MKLFFVFGLLAVLATVVYAWDKEDHEIFDLVGSVENSEGKGTTFYSWLDVPSTATTAEIARSYRKKSMLLHPDKNPGTKGAHERFARLGVVAAILRNKESRKRYDFFYKNGVPKWRGTGYYYSRFRPGLGSVLVFLTVLSSGLQYLVQKMNYKRDIERIRRFMSEARSIAWGPKMSPVEGQRKVKVNVGGPSRMDDEGNVTNGRWIDMVVEGPGVFILDEAGDLHPLDESSATVPTISRTWFLALATSLFHRVVKRKSEEPEAEEETDGTESEVAESGTSTPASNEDGVVKGGRLAAVKAGGKRRKAVRKR